MLWQTISKYSYENLELKNKLQKRATSPSAFVQEIIPGFQHCFDEKPCGNKWRINPDLDYHKESRRKRDLSNPLLDRKRPRFGLSARTTTQRPNENKAQSSRFSQRSFPSANAGSARFEDSRTPRGSQVKTKSAPPSFTPSQRKYQRTGKAEQTTESVQRKSPTSAAASRPKFGRNRQAPTPTSTTSKPRFGRGRAQQPVISATTTTRPRFGRGRVASSFSSTTSRPVISRNRGIYSSLTTTTSRPKFDRSKIFKTTATDNRGANNSSAADGESKLPLTFRQHHILALSKTVKPTVGDNIEEKVVLTEATNTTETTTEVKPEVKEKEDEASKNDSEDEYVDEDEDESDENYVEGDDDVDEKVDSKARVSDEKNVSVSPSLKISEDTSDEKGIKILNIFPVTSQGTVFKAEIGGKEYRFNGKDWVKVENDDDKSVMEEDDDEAYSDEYYEEEDDVINSKNSQNEAKNTEGSEDKGNSGDPKSFKNLSSVKDADDDAYEDESYEDEWESEEIDNSDLDHRRVPDNESNRLSDEKYLTGRGVTNGDMTELSPTGTTLNVKQDNEFELGETEEDDFEETNRAVRKTSLGRRKDQALGGGAKFSVGNGKASSSKAILGDINGDDNEKSADNGMGVKYSPEDDVYDDSEGMDEEEFYEEDLQDNLPGLSTQRGFSKPNGKSRTAYDDDEYVDEYEETSTNGKSGVVNAKFEPGGFNRGSLLHLPIPTLKRNNARMGMKSGNDDDSRELWDDSEENYTQEQDEEYANEKFLDEDEQYDDQEEGHDHTVGGKDADEEMYPDEDEEMNRSGRVKNTPFRGTKDMTPEDPEYNDDEETRRKNDEGNISTGKVNTRQGVRPWSNQSREKESKLTPLPYIRFVNPEIEEEDTTTPLPSTPNLFRTVKPRQRSWKQASAPEPPPVILPRRTTAAPVVQTTQPPRGYRKGKFGSAERGVGRRGGTIDEREQPVTQAPRRWTPRQQVTQSDNVNNAKGFLPTRGRYNNHAREQRNQARTVKTSSPKSPRFYLPKPTTPPLSTKATSPPTVTNRYRTTKPRSRTNVRKRVTDIVQFSESQVSKSRQNFPIPYPADEKDSDYFYPSNAEKSRLDSSKSRKFKDFESNDRNDYIIPQSVLPPLNDNSPIAATPSLESNETYFPLFMTTSTEATPEAFSCIGLQLYVYHAERSNPRLFHYCSHGFSRGQILDFRFSCVKGMSFSEEAQSCV